MAVLHIPVEDDQGVSAWPAKFTDTERAIRRRQLGDLRFAQEYLCSPISLFGSDLQLSWLKVFDYDRAQEDQLFKEGEGEYFFGIDPSISGHGDFFVICVVWKSKPKDDSPQRFYIVDFIREQAQLDRMTVLIKQYAAVYHPITINVEAVQAQQLLVQHLVDRTNLPVRSYIPKGRKEDRISLMASIHFSTGRCQIRGHREEGRPDPQFDPQMSSFVQEWLSFPRGRHDDCLDATESALEAAAASGMAVSLSSEAPSADDETKRQHWLEKIRIRTRRW